MVLAGIEQRILETWAENNSLLQEDFPALTGELQMFPGLWTEVEGALYINHCWCRILPYREPTWDG